MPVVWSPDYPGPKVIGDCQSDADLAHPRAAETQANNVNTLLMANVWNYLRAHETFFNNLNGRVTTLEGGGGGGASLVACFSARRSTSDQTSGSIAIFNDTASPGFNNEGYNASTGEFTCPSNDYYSFRAQVVTRGVGEATFSAGFFGILVGTTAYAFGASFPDPAVGTEQIPGTVITLGPIFLTASSVVTVKRLDDFASTPSVGAFDTTIRVKNHPASRFEAWRRG